MDESKSASGSRLSAKDATSGEGGDLDGSEPQETIAVIEAERQITRVLYGYCRGVDRLDLVAVRASYHPGATDDHGSYCGDVDGFIAYLEGGLASNFVTTVHALSNILIKVQGTVAFSESYVHATHVVDPSLGGGLLTVVGRYVDRFEHLDGRWAITRRRFLRDWERVEAMSVVHGEGISAQLPDRCYGKRSPEDYSYHLNG